MTDWVIFTNLEETLLDEPARGGERGHGVLERLHGWRIPVVLCSTKTAAEMGHYQRQLGIEAPFAVENGGAIHVPRGFFTTPPGAPSPGPARDVYTLGVPYDSILRAMQRLKTLTNDCIRGFDDMSADEVSREMGMPVSMAVLAKAREWSEPFRFVRRGAEFALRIGEWARGMGLRVSETQGHYLLHGDTDKGRAVRLLLALFRRNLGTIRTIGAGSTAEDAAMLAATDVPIIMPRLDGTVDPGLASGLPKALLASTPGAVGWGETVLNVLESA